MGVRIRLQELLREKQTTAYRVALDSKGRIGMRTIYRLRSRDGRMRSFDNDLLDALCDVLGVTPGELLER